MREFMFTVDSGLPKAADKDERQPFSMRLVRTPDFASDHVVWLTGPDGQGNTQSIGIESSQMDLIARAWLSMSEREPF